MRKVRIALNEHYHIYNRGNNKQIIFLDDKDRIRFLFLVLYFQSPSYFPQVGRFVSYFVKHSVFDIENKEIEKMLKARYAGLVAFALMPNHFHLIVREVQEGGISQYMQRVLDAYTKYFNTKYEKSGHLFQGPYQAVHVNTNEQLLHLTAYIHRNPTEIKCWHSKEILYPWSSYQDYALKNRWGKLLDLDIVSSQFINGDEYKKFTESSGTKENYELDENLLFD